MGVTVDQQILQFLLLEKLALGELCQPSGVGQIAEFVLEGCELVDLSGREGIEKLFCDKKVEVTKSARFEVPILRKLLSL